jgi:hypothetical protein
VVGDGDFVDRREGPGGVVIVGGVPLAGRVRGGHVVDLVDVHASPALAEVGGEYSGAGLAAGLVAEDHGPATMPAEGVGADEPAASVVGDLDGATMLKCRFELSPWGR